MFVLVKNKITNEYNTIYKKDVEKFKSLNAFFNSDPKLQEGETVDFNYEIIEDLDEIKKILETEFASQNRGNGYNKDLTSVSRIAYSLFPLDINNEKFLIRWKNNTPLKEQEDDKNNILSRGTFIHKILQNWVMDKEARLADKPLIDSLIKLQKAKKPSKKILQQIDCKILNDIRKYIELAYTDEEIVSKIPNLSELKEELAYIATKSLPDFIKNELIFTDLIYSEIFLCIDDYIQGSIDNVCYYKNNFTIIDYKTTSSLDKKTGKPKFKSSSQLQGYARQLYLYNQLLKKSKMAHLYEDKEPNFVLVQIHLINGKYKKFNIPNGLVKSQGLIVERVLKWYHDVVNGNFKDVIELYEDDCDDIYKELEFLTI